MSDGQLSRYPRRRLAVFKPVRTLSCGRLKEGIPTGAESYSYSVLYSIFRFVGDQVGCEA